MTAAYLRLVAVVIGPRDLHAFHYVLLKRGQALDILLQRLQAQDMQPNCCEFHCNGSLSTPMQIQQLEQHGHNAVAGYVSCSDADCVQATHSSNLEHDAYGCC